MPDLILPADSDKEINRQATIKRRKEFADKMAKQKAFLEANPPKPLGEKP